VTDANISQRPTHYHVVAAQDWGGSQEFWRLDKTDPLTKQEAEALADRMLEADLASQDGGEARVASQRMFGAEWDELVSGNVAPGWDGIWVVPCDEPLEFHLDNLLDQLMAWVENLAAAAADHRHPGKYANEVLYAAEVREA